MESSKVKIVLSAFVHDHLAEDLSYYIVVSRTKNASVFIVFYFHECSLHKHLLKFIQSTKSQHKGVL